MKRVLISVGIFLIAFASSCITFCAIHGSLTVDRIIVAIIVSTIAVLYERSKARAISKETTKST